MQNFSTANSEYEIDTKNQLISGGQFGDIQYSYINIHIIKNQQALIQLEDGRVIKTSEVIKIQ